MRLCDYCALEIQDEAVYCRYCHRQLKAYAGIRGKTRCPYCAEWIERDALECEYCEHALTPPAPEPLPSPAEPAAQARRTWDPRDVLLEESPAPTAGETPAAPAARRSRFFGLGSKGEPPQPPLDEEPFAPDTEGEGAENEAVCSGGADRAGLPLPMNRSHRSRRCRLPYGGPAMSSRRHSLLLQSWPAEVARSRRLLRHRSPKPERAGAPPASCSCWV